MSTTTHVFTHPRTHLASAAKHYQRTDGQDSWGGLTLVFAHGISFHKELWEPVIQRIFQLDSHHAVRDAWSIDWQSHGESGILNKHLLDSREPVSAEEYADFLAFFCSLDLLAGCRIVGIGHSAAASAWVLAATAVKRRLSLASVILIEPVLVAPPVLPGDMRFAVGKANRRTASSRPFEWPDIRAATSFLATQYPWKVWDPNVLKLYITYGLSMSPSGTVSTRCMKRQECGLYELSPSCAHISAGAELARLCARIPVHMVFGERAPDAVSYQARQKMVDVKAGRRLASIQIIPKTGHFCVYEKPGAIAQNILSVVLSLGVEIAGAVARL